MLARLLAVLALAALGGPAMAQNDFLSPEQSAARMKVPEGFRVRLVAGEPEVRKPIAMTTDDRGRLWVVESASYPHWLSEGKTGKDRILIFEDNGAGKFKSKVFLDDGTNLSGIAVGFGGVWLCAPPYLLFIPVKAGEDRPAGPAQVLLDGWSLKAKHNVFNNLQWGPDGWLYGCNGITDLSVVGKAGAPKSERIALNCGVWRYQPVRKQFETFAWGTTNPWGLDWDDHGELFITNCVIKHVFHMPQGGHFVRMFGQDLNPHCYGLIESCADHIHWAGGSWTSSRGGQGAHSETGGGHAHSGAMVYLGDNWPETYRNRIFMGNLHGNRINQDILERQGSGYVAKHGLDFLFGNDPWFRPLSLLYGADGGVFLSDWHDTGECHNYDKTHPSGRIYKVTFGEPKPVQVDLAGKSDEELVQLQTHRNEWYVRRARWLLQERAAGGKLGTSVAPALRKLLDEQPSAPGKLRALWALHSIGALTEADHLKLLEHAEESVRGWAMRLLLEERKTSEKATARLAEMARKDASAYVRLALVSGLQRLPAGQRWDIAEGLASHADDAQDTYLPLMLWYGIEAAVPADPERATRLLAGAKVPLVRQFIARRLAELTE